MDIVERVAHRPVCIDTAPFIYLIERHPRYHPIIRPLFESLAAGSLVGTTSVITLDLRARYGIRVADAIQAATGIRHGCAVFVTNDVRLKCLREFSDVIVLEDAVSPQT